MTNKSYGEINEMSKFKVTMHLTRVRDITRSVSSRHGKFMGSMLGPNRVLVNDVKGVSTAALSDTLLSPSTASPYRFIQIHITNVVENLVISFKKLKMK